MKKILILTVLSLFLITGCKGSLKNEDIIQNVKDHYINLDTKAYTVSISTSIYDKTQDFKINYTYNKENFDLITILEPESIKDINLKIIKNNNQLYIDFAELQVETLLKENLGINPIDVTSFAIFDIINRDYREMSCDDMIKITYEEDEILKDIYLNPKSYDIIKIEVYIDNEMVLLANYT